MTLFYVNFDVTQINVSIERNVFTIILYFCKRYSCTYRSAISVHAAYIMAVYLSNV